MNISGAARLAAVIGHPIKHSLSPRLHNYWLRQCGIDGAYIPLEIAPEHLEKTLRALPLMGFKGCNVTLPHKESLLSIVDEVLPVARKIGAINTVTVDNSGRLIGTNTDAYGFIENIRSLDPYFAFSHGPAVVLGAGGAARAVCAGLLDAGVPLVYLLNRTRDKADIIREHLGDKIQVESWENRNAVLAKAAILVNTTSLGMVGKDPLDIDLTLLPTDALVTDIVYNPLETPLLKQAKLRGNHIVDGLGMLIYQAILGFEAWFGTRPEVTPELRQFLLEIKK